MRSRGANARGGASPAARSGCSALLSQALPEVPGVSGQLASAPERSQHTDCQESCSMSLKKRRSSRD